jgi:solute carrier family 25 phosphate transporter 3
MYAATLALAACTALALQTPTTRRPLAKLKVAPPQAPFAAPDLATRRAALQTTAASIAFAALPAIAKRAPEEQLVWIPVASDVASKPQLAFAQVEKRYGLRFVEYLARILLNYDPASRRWWEARRREAAGASSADQRARKRQQAYSSFVASVELSLARGYLDDAGTAKLFDALSTNVLPRTIAGRRRLAQLGALSTTDLKPTANAVINAQNGTIDRVEVLAGGGGYALKPPPKVSVDFTPTSNKTFFDGPQTNYAENSEAPKFTVKMTPTGKVACGDLISKGGGYDQAPFVKAPPPPLGGTPAKLTAIVQNGSVTEILVEDPGSGYDGGKVVPLIIGPPNRGGLQATATVGWDYAVGEILVESGGSGFNESGTLSLMIPAGAKGQAKAIATLTKGDCGCLNLKRSDFRGNSSDNLLRLLPAGLAPTLRRGRYVIPEVEALEYNQTQQTGVDYVFGTRGLEPVREDEVSLKQYAVLGACGAVCTAAAHVALTPLELVKTKLQTSAATSAVDVTKEIYEDDGLLALFAGWEPIIVGYFINGFFAFGLTEFLKRIVAAQLASDQAWAATVVGSLGAAVVAVAVVTPFEAAKVRIQTLKANPSLLDTWSALIEERGGWYDGLFGRSLGALIAKDVVFAAFKFAVFDAVRGAILQAYPPAANDALFVSIIAGAVAGACGAVASQPLDTTFARVETAKKGQDTGVFATFRRVVDEEGFNALYAGLAPRMFFAAALLAIEFAIFEALRDAFHVSRDDFAYALDALATAVRTPSAAPALLDSAAQAAAQVDQFGRI